MGKALLIIGSIFLTFVILEIGIRLIAPGSLHNQNLRVYDAEVGYKFPLNLDTTIDTGRGEHRLVTNEHGYIGVSFPLEKPEHEWRIANIGDSYVEGVQEVNFDKNFSALIGNWLNLNAGGEKTYQSLNFGVSGRGTLEELWTYKHFVSKTDPDLVILWITLANDFGNNYFPNQSPDDLVQNSYGRIKQLLKKSALFTFAFERTKNNPIVGKMMRKLHLTNTIYEAGGESNGPSFEEEINFSVTPEYKEKQILAYSVTENLLKEFKDSTTKQGGKFLVVIIPAYLSQEDFNEKFFAYYPEANPLKYDFSKPTRVWTELLDKHSISYLDLTNDLVQYTSSNYCGELFGDHFTECGHKVVSEILGKYILSSIDLSN